MYYLLNGEAVSAGQIKAAFEAGKAVLVHGRTEGGTSTGLALDGQHFDTRDECYSVWDEAWTRQPETLAQALRAARV